jgi:hypothetical protein
MDSMSAKIHEYLKPTSSNGQNAATKTLQGSQQDHASTAFPYLEKIQVMAQKNPYAMLGAMIGVAAIVVTAVTTFAIAIFTGAFLLYGKMSGMEVSQRQILEAFNKNEEEVKVLRTYEASVLARQNYIAGLMDAKRKDQLNQYDKANPLPRPPDKINKEKQ